MPTETPRPWRQVVASMRGDRNGVLQCKDSIVLNSERSTTLALPRWYHSGVFSTKSSGEVASTLGSSKDNDVVVLSAIAHRMADTLPGRAASECEYLTWWLVQLLKQAIANVICREDLHGKAMRLVEVLGEDRAQPSSSRDAALHRGAAPLHNSVQLDLAVHRLLTGDAATFGLQRRSAAQREDTKPSSTDAIGTNVTTLGKSDAERQHAKDADSLWCVHCSASDRTIHTTDVVNALGVVYELQARGGPKVR